VKIFSFSQFASSIGAAFLQRRASERRRQCDVAAQRQWLATAVEVETFLASWRGHYRASDLDLTERLYLRHRREYL
jgi:hypothetical protein